jgi:uncharacterized protein YqhQ
MKFVNLAQILLEASEFGLKFLSISSKNVDVEDPSSEEEKWETTTAQKKLLLWIKIKPRAEAG